MDELKDCPWNEFCGTQGGVGHWNRLLELSFRGVSGCYYYIDRDRQLSFDWEPRKERTGDSFTLALLPSNGSNVASYGKGVPLSVELSDVEDALKDKLWPTQYNWFDWTREFRPNDNICNNSEYRLCGGYLFRCPYLLLLIAVLLSGPLAGITRRRSIVQQFPRIPGFRINCSPNSLGYGFCTAACFVSDSPAAKSFHHCSWVTRRVIAQSQS